MNAATLRIGSLEIVLALAFFAWVAVRPRTLDAHDMGNLTPVRIELEIFEREGRRHFEGVCPVVIGRSSDADAMVMDSEVSRRHARFEAQNEVVYVSDLGSRNGTFLNSHRLDGAIEVLPGDTVDVGTVRIVFLGQSAVSQREA
jgi:pSer/pThr/pTyr-binding forkhead associated (FHA) protein